MKTPKPNAAEIEKRYNYVAGAVADFMSMSPCIAFMCSHGFISGQIPRYNAETMWPTYYMYWFYTRPQIQECLNDPNFPHVRSVIEQKIELMKQGDEAAGVETAIYSMGNTAITDDDLVGAFSTMGVSGGGFGR